MFGLFYELFDDFCAVMLSKALCSFYLFLNVFMVVLVELEVLRAILAPSWGVGGHLGSKPGGRAPSWL